MDRHEADAKRLRINRITLIQQLDADELIPKLVETEIISSDKDVEFINQGSSKIDRARRLIDCFLNENHRRPSNWFLIFRNILLENPTTYSKLVNLLDNTIIENSQIETFNDEQQITHMEFDPYAMNKIFIRGSFHKVVDNLPCHCQIPENLFEELSCSTHAYDQEQLLNERQIFDHMRRLELLIRLHKQDPTLSNQNLFQFDIIQTFLVNQKYHHYFFKYFYSLSTINGLHYDRELIRIYQHLLSQNEQYEFSTLIEQGFLFYEFLFQYARYDYACEIIESIVQTLTKQINKQQTNIWIYLFRSCCALVQIHNQNLDIKQAWARIEAANEIADNLKTKNIEIPCDDQAWLYAVSSQTAYEDGNFDACIQYSYRGLKLADKENHSLIIDLFSTLTQGLTAKWIMNKAQSTAIMAVQYAAKYLNRNSPKYVQALLQLTQYSNEFIQDVSSVELAQYTYNRARIVYGYESLAVAQCHRALSKSLITLASTVNSSSSPRNNPPPFHPTTPMIESSPNVYYHHAHEAFRIAHDWLGVTNRIRLFSYKMTLTHALQARLATNQSDNNQKMFDEAMRHLQECSAIAKDVFGSVSFKLAQVHRLQSAVYLSSRMFHAAENELQICLQIYKLCLPPNSFHYLVTKASLGLLYRQERDYKKAIVIFQNIAQYLDTKTQSFRWINIVLESLADCYAYFEQTNDEYISPRVKTKADQIRKQLYQWRQMNSNRTNLMSFIYQELSHSIEQFIRESTKFQQTTDRLHALLHAQQKAKT